MHLKTDSFQGYATIKLGSTVLATSQTVGAASGWWEWVAFPLSTPWVIPDSSNTYTLLGTATTATNTCTNYYSNPTPEFAVGWTQVGYLGQTMGISVKSMSYPTSQPYYVTTSDNNQIDLSNVSEINSITITKTEPTNTSIKALVSFDDRTTWKKWNGSSWETHTGGLDNLQTGNTITEIETGLTNYDILSETYLDFSFDLSTTDSSVTPDISQIDINYDPNVAPNDPVIDNYNDGSSGSDNTPDLQFDLNDPDA